MRKTATFVGVLIAALSLFAQAQFVKDDLGRDVEPVGAVARVATLSPFLAESVVAIGG